MNRKLVILILSGLAGLCFPSVGPAEDFVDTLATRTWNYLDSATTNHLPWSWMDSLGDGGKYCNPTEIGFYMLCNVGAYELNLISWDSAAAEIELTLSHLATWQNGTNSHDSSLFYQWYWPDSLSVGYNSVDSVVPSVDNAWLAVTLMTIREYADSNDTLPKADSIQIRCDSILGKLDFLAWYDPTTRRFYHGAYRNPRGGFEWNFYSNENRIINFVARALTQLDRDDFLASLTALGSCGGFYDAIKVRRTNWDGSYFTYTVPALFINEMETCYGDSTIDPATSAQIEYARASSYTTWGISDAYWDTTYMKLGAPPRCSPDGSDPDSGIVAPHVSALALITSYDSLAIANLRTLADSFPRLYHHSLGFFDSVRDSTKEPGSRFSALGQEYIFLSLMNYRDSLLWTYFYGYAGVQTAHDELVEWLSCVGIEESDLCALTPLSGKFYLGANHPNPFSQLTVISLISPKRARTRLNIYNLSGQLVQTLIDELTESGYHEAAWDGKDMEGKELSNGVYFCRLQAGNFTDTKKLLLLK